MTEITVAASSSGSWAHFTVAAQKSAPTSPCILRLVSYQQYGNATSRILCQHTAE